jgi:hypothetical protein
MPLKVCFKKNRFQALVSMYFARIYSKNISGGLFLTQAPELTPNQISGSDLRNKAT